MVAIDLDSVGQLLATAMNCFSLMYIEFCLFNELYEKKYTVRWIYLVAFIISGMISFGVTIWGVPIVNLTRGFLMINVVSIVLYKGQIKVKLFYNITYVGLTLIMDIFTVLLISKYADGTLVGTLMNAQVMLISSIINLIGAFLVYKILVYNHKKNNLNKG